MLLALVAYGEELGGLVLRALERRWVFVIVAAAVFALALPSVGQTWRPNQMGAFFGEHAVCDAPWRGGVANFHACQHDLMWFQRPLPLYALRGVDSPGGVVTSVLVGLALLGCLLLLRDELRGAALPTLRSVGNAAPTSSISSWRASRTS